jgi:hypothetical protein
MPAIRAFRIFGGELDLDADEIASSVALHHSKFPNTYQGMTPYLPKTPNPVSTPLGNCGKTTNLSPGNPDGKGPKHRAMARH